MQFYSEDGWVDDAKDALIIEDMRDADDYACEILGLDPEQGAEGYIAHVSHHIPKLNGVAKFNGWVICRSKPKEKV